MHGKEQEDKGRDGWEQSLYRRRKQAKELENTTLTNTESITVEGNAKLQIRNAYYDRLRGRLYLWKISLFPGWRNNPYIT